MATELFSLCARITGWRSQRGDGYSVTSNLDGISIFYYSDDCATVESAFYCACRRTLLRRYLPFLSAAPRELRIIVRAD